MPKRKERLGHLFIHNVTVKEAEDIMRQLFPQKEADWWPTEEVDQFDSAAMVTINKRPGSFHSLRGGKHFGRAICQ